MLDDDLIFDAAILRDTITTILTAVGMLEEEAAITAEVLVAADLRGHESHGVARLESYYVRPLQQGTIAARPSLEVVRDSLAALVLDAQNGMGHPATKKAMDLCIERARHTGVCLAVITHSNHYGIAGYYPLQAAQAGMLGLCMTTAGSLVVPTGGRNALLGTNPIAFAAPGKEQRPFMLDMATSVVPVGKIEVKARRGIPLPQGWAVDPHGLPTTDAQAVLDSVHGGAGLGGLLPLGGLEAGHKGYGLAAMVDILAGLLGGGYASLGFSERIKDDSPHGVGHLVAAINIDAFIPLAQFQEAFDRYALALRAAPAAAGSSGVLVAGDPEFTLEEQRLQHGVPILCSVGQGLQALATEFGLNLPAL